MLANYRLVVSRVRPLIISIGLCCICCDGGHRLWGGSGKTVTAERGMVMLTEACLSSEASRSADSVTWLSARAPPISEGEEVFVPHLLGDQSLCRISLKPAERGGGGGVEVGAIEVIEVIHWNLLERVMGMKSG